MKRLIIVPAMLVCLTGATTSSHRVQTKPVQIQTKERQQIDVKIDKIDSLLKKL